jgi:two-component system, NarL family, response regulator LiaR
MNFTSRELEVLKYICEGCSDEEIAKTLFISVATVKFHIHNLLQKSSMRNRTQLVILAFRNGILDENQS